MGAPSVRRDAPAPQIHLDFHTSEHIAGRRDPRSTPRRSPDTLARAHVDSVTCFARCHHGWIYFDTTVHPERRHPHLERDLLREQIEACHARGIRVPIYTTVQWDHLTAAEHPEWRIVTPEGALEGTPPFEAGFYRKLCLNSPYVELLQRAHARHPGHAARGRAVLRHRAGDAVRLPLVPGGDGGGGARPGGPGGARRVRAGDDRPLPDRHVGVRARGDAGRDDLLQRRPRRPGRPRGRRRLLALRAGIAAERPLGLRALPGRRSATRARSGRRRSGRRASSTPRGATSTRSRTAPRWSTSASGCWRSGRAA